MIIYYRFADKICDACPRSVNERRTPAFIHLVLSHRFACLKVAKTIQKACGEYPNELDGSTKARHVWNLPSPLALGTAFCSWPPSFPYTLFPPPSHILAPHSHLHSSSAFIPNNISSSFQHLPNPPPAANHSRHKRSTRQSKTICLRSFRFITARFSHTRLVEVKQQGQHGLPNSPAESPQYSQYLFRLCLSLRSRTNHSRTHLAGARKFGAEGGENSREQYQCLFQVD